jgi:hypothetical protein
MEDDDSITSCLFIGTQTERERTKDIDTFVEGAMVEQQQMSVCSILLGIQRVFVDVDCERLVYQ